jgi:hypothetical protein
MKNLNIRHLKRLYQSLKISAPLIKEAGRYEQDKNYLHHSK